MAKLVDTGLHLVIHIDSLLCSRIGLKVCVQRIGELLALFSGEIKIVEPFLVLSEALPAARTKRTGTHKVTHLREFIRTFKGRNHLLGSNGIIFELALKIDKFV